MRHHGRLLMVVVEDDPLLADAIAERLRCVTRGATAGPCSSSALPRRYPAVRAARFTHYLRGHQTARPPAPVAGARTRTTDRPHPPPDQSVLGSSRRPRGARPARSAGGAPLTPQRVRRGRGRGRRRDPPPPAMFTPALPHQPGGADLGERGDHDQDRRANDRHARRVRGSRSVATRVASGT
jgi:hypothetical protein